MSATKRRSEDQSSVDQLPTSSGNVEAQPGNTRRKGPISPPSSPPTGPSPKTKRPQIPTPEESHWPQGLVSEVPSVESQTLLQQQAQRAFMDCMTTIRPCRLKFRSAFRLYDKGVEEFGPGLESIISQHLDDNRQAQLRHLREQRATYKKLVPELEEAEELFDQRCKELHKTCVMEIDRQEPQASEQAPGISDAQGFRELDSVAAFFPDSHEVLRQLQYHKENLVVLNEELRNMRSMAVQHMAVPPGQRAPEGFVFDAALLEYKIHETENLISDLRARLHESESEDDASDEE